ncbi:hypothetical protein AVEN_109581-1 [Araneus ventricosus]|uniref:Uncharacterized protein n=1 Tax=Araneus ventricosus TaxID=182803 RepID=A0A4Y2VPK6_ARAVE|nr:hypothetical protein AVEN_109581-1 [Araneus ventricosus]
MFVLWKTSNKHIIFDKEGSTIIHAMLKYITNKIDMTFAKCDERALLRIREQENTRSKAHCSSEMAGNCMDSKSSGIQDISDQLRPSSTYCTQE